MATQVPAKKNSAYTYTVALTSQADTDIFKTSPTLAAGDVTVSIDGGNFANVGTLPTQIQSTGILEGDLTAGEMNGDIIAVRFNDAAGDEWQDLLVVIHTVTTSQVDDLATASAVAALNDVSVTDITQRQIPDSVPADGTRPTLEQALYMITQFLYERAVSSTTVSVKKVDGSTELLTLTLDDNTTPTSITRAT